ncbi:MAG: hypothetical protein NVS3B7_07850 [Candidatus Elarobacter sp.]
MAATKGRTSRASETSTLRVGDQAPEIKLPSHNGDTWSLGDARGENVVVVFYPFAFSGA